MKLSEILQAFHGLEACDRVDLICRMLRHCLAFESRFLGTVLLDASKEHYKSQVNKIEIHANRVSYYKPFQESGLSHQVCLKLCSSLSVVHSDNRPVAEVVFQLLNDKKVLTFFEDCNELKVRMDTVSVYRFNNSICMRCSYSLLASVVGIASIVDLDTLNKRLNKRAAIICEY